MGQSNSVVPFAGTASALALAIALSAAPQPARAHISLSTSAGSACKPAYGASTRFNFTELYARNNGTTDEYLVCGFANWSFTGVGSARPLKSLSIWVNTGAAGGTAVCVAKMGYWTGGATVVSMATRSLTFDSYGSGNLLWEEADLPRSEEFQVLSMNCKLPGGAKLGLIQRIEAEPPSGYGWTP